jgi:hypothetical protein
MKYERPLLIFFGRGLAAEGVASTHVGAQERGHGAGQQSAYCLICSDEDPVAGHCNNGGRVYNYACWAGEGASHTCGNGATP